MRKPPKHIAGSTQQYHYLCYLYNYLYFLKVKVCGKCTPKHTKSHK